MKLRNLFISLAISLAPCATHAQEIIYDNTAENGVRMLGTSPKACAMEVNFFASFYLTWCGNDEVGDYYLNLDVMTRDIQTIPEGGRVRLTLKNNDVVYLVTPISFTSEKAEKPFETDVIYPYEICSFFHISQTELRMAKARGIKGISIETTTKKITGAKDTDVFEKYLPIMYNKIQERLSKK